MEDDIRYIPLTPEDQEIVDREYVKGEEVLKKELSRNRSVTIAYWNFDMCVSLEAIPGGTLEEGKEIVERSKRLKAGTCKGFVVIEYFDGFPTRQSCYTKPRGETEPQWIQEPAQSPMVQVWMGERTGEPKGAID